MRTLSIRLSMNAVSMLLLLVFLPISACKEKGASPGNALEKNKQNKIEVGQISEITLERGACFGQCPEYKVSFRKDDSATYIGEAYTSMIGTFRAEQESCSQCYFSNLEKLLFALRFFDLQEIYEKDWADAGTITIRVKASSGIKVVKTNKPEVPIEIWGIASAIDGIVAKIKWKKSAQDSQ